MQPVIGITMCLDHKDRITRGVEYNYVRREYSQALKRAGAQPIFLDPSIDPMVAARLCDGIVISGGEDMDPALYGQDRQSARNEEPRTRTDWERRLIAACDEWEVSVLGVCYGEQLLNVHYGGTLYQDIANDFGSSLGHGSSVAPVQHTVTLEKDFLGYIRGQKVTVTARHHQAIDRVADGFDVVARADDGCIEAISGNGHYGIQWHAESDKSGEIIYGGFVDLCMARKRAVTNRRRITRPRILTEFFSLITPRKKILENDNIDIS